MKLFLLCRGRHRGRWNWGETVSPNTEHAVWAGIQHITLVGVSWLSSDRTQSCLQRRDWSRLNLSQIFSLSSSFRLSLHLLNPPSPPHTKTRPLHTSVFSNMWIYVYKLQEDNIYRTWRMIYDWTWNVCVVHVHTSLYFLKSSHLLCGFMCSAVHIEHKQARSNVAVHFEFGLKLRWQSATQRFLFKMCDGCYSSGFS